MNILVLNAGSSSHKLCLYSVEGGIPEMPPRPAWEAQIDWSPQQAQVMIESQISTGNLGGQKVTSTSRLETLSTVLNSLWQGENPVIRSPKDIDVVGHRVVHGGQIYQSSVVVTAAVKKAIADLIPLAPVHNPVNLEGIELMEQLLGDGVQQVAVFDTAFHCQMPDVASIYPGPHDWLEQGIRRYGFHGISHQYCTRRAAQILKQNVTELRLIICHLGNGGSLTAVKGGRSIDTTMGFTPLEGLMMGTRSGSVDPGILIYLMRQGYSADQLDQLLNTQSGLKGMSGISHDLREIEAAIASGNEKAKLAYDIYLHRLNACLGAMLMSLGGVDALVFTAGVGEHSTTVRASACEALAFLGLKMDATQNEGSPVDQDIATEDSTVRVLVIHTQEDWAIAQDCLRLCGEPLGL